MLTIIVPVNSNLVVQKLESQTGYTTINLGFTELIEEAQTIVHLIRRNHIQEIIYNIESEVNKTELSPWITNKMENIKRKAGILMIHRDKRALMNIIGKTSKWLFGTMDEDDKQNIDEQLKILEENNSKTIEGLNHQIRINDYFNETLRLFTQNNIENQNRIIRKYNNLSEEIKTLIKNQRTLDILLKLQVTEDKLNQVLDNIASIKAGILHPGILTAEEIRDFKINVEKLENARTGILLVDKDKLLITIKIPTKYKKIPYKLLTPLPDKNYQEIIEEPISFFEVDKEKYVMEKNVLYRNELKPLKTCLNSKCEMRFNTKEKIVKLNNNVILGINLNEPKIINNCDERNIRIKGNYIFNIQNCTIKINNKSFVHINKTFEDNDIFEIFYDNWEKTNITLEKIALKNMDNLEEIHQIKTHKKISYGLHGITIVTVIILILGIVYKICSKEKLTYEIKNKSLHQESKPNLKEGGVMLSQDNMMNFRLFGNQSGFNDRPT